MNEGAFIVVEGIDGSGSTTVTERLTAHLTSKKMPVHRTCEPSGGPIGALIRQILGHRVVVPSAQGSVSPGFTTMALLFASDRMDHLEAEVLPRLREGVVVISDRYDLSSLAYQSATAPVDDPEQSQRVVGWIRELNRQARRPDFTLVLDVRPEVAAERRRSRGGTRELYEEGELQKRLARAYAAAEELVPGDRIVHIDANVGVAEVVRASIVALEQWLGA
jgi:dTMP kinase